MKTAFRLATLATSLSLAIAGSVHADTLLNEGFDDISSLSGWVLKNNSVGPANAWFQGNSGIFPAASGGPTSYIGSNFLAADSGAISNWLITPVLSLSQTVKFDFSLRLAGSNAGFIDSVEVYLSTAGISSDVGSTTGSTGSFGTLLGTYTASSDTGWMDESLYIAAMGAGASGRIAFRYVVDDVALNGDYIGIDSVTANAVPEPGSFALVGLGLAGAAYARRRKA